MGNCIIHCGTLVTYSHPLTSPQRYRYVCVHIMKTLGLFMIAKLEWVAEDTINIILYIIYKKFIYCNLFENE